MIIGKRFLSDKWRIVKILELQLVMFKVTFAQVRPLFEHYNLEAGGGKLFGHDAPSAARAHHHKIHRSFVLEFRHRTAIHRPLLYSLS